MPPRQWKMNVLKTQALATLFRSQEDGNQQGSQKDARRLIPERCLAAYTAMVFGVHYKLCKILLTRRRNCNNGRVNGEIWCCFGLRFGMD